MGENPSFDITGVLPQTGSPRPAGVWEPPASEELQKEIPQYKVLELIGRGGMGAVYKGWQVSLERYVAIKVLPPGTDDGDAHFAARFKQEAKTMAKFMHPGIVGVFDAGETTAGLLYIGMEFVAVGVMRYNMLTGDIPRGRFKPSSEKTGCDPRCDAIVNKAMENERGDLRIDGGQGFRLFVPHKGKERPSKLRLPVGEPHDLFVEVRQTRVRISLDGALQVDHEGALPGSKRDNAFFPASKVDHPFIGIGVCGGDITVHSAELREVTGTGKTTAP